MWKEPRAYGTATVKLCLLTLRVARIKARQNRSFFLRSFVLGQSMDAGVLPHKHRSMNSDREIGKGDRDERIWPNFAKQGIAEFL